MRAEVRGRRRPDPPSKTGPAATEPRGAQGSDGSGKRGPGPGAEPPAGPGPAHRQPGGKSRGAAEPVPRTRARAPPDVPPQGLAGCVTQASSLSRRPGGRSSAALMWLQAPHPPRARPESGLIVLPGRSGPPRARPHPAGTAPRPAAGLGGPVPRRGRGKRGPQSAVGACEPPGTRGPRSSGRVSVHVHGTPSPRSPSTRLTTT